MLQAVHSETTVPATESPGGIAAPEFFAPFLRLAMNESALLAPFAAPQEAGARATEALAGSRRAESAAGHWANESLARAQGQSLGVNLAEIAAGELASPGPARPKPAAESAPSHEQAARQREGSRAAAEPARSTEDASGRRAQADSGAPDQAEQRPPGGNDRSPARGHAATHASASASGGAGGVAGGGGAGGGAPGAIQGAGQIQGGPGGVSTAAASAWKLEAAGSAARPAGAGGPAHAQTPSRALQTQMERGLGAVLRQGGGSLTLRLTPASLGEVRVHMTMEHGTVRARFESTSGEARELMTAGLGALRAALEARGLRVESLEVAVDAHDRAGRPAGEPHRGPEPQEGSQRQPAGDDRASGGSDKPSEGHNSGRSGESDQRPGGHGAGRDRAEQAENEHHGPEDPVDIHTADDASETLVSLRLDTVG